jgi:nucleoside-diphosphate-sugar epimerase
MIKCGITGSRGVLGRRILKILPYKFYKFKKDITKKNEVKKWVANNDFDIFIHLAAKVPARRVSKDYEKAYNVNVNGTLNLIDSLLKKKIKPKWLFFASTSHVYKLNFKSHKISEKENPKPQTKYGKTKFIAENHLKKKLNQSSIKLCIGRIFSFTDKNQKLPFVIPSITKKIRLSKKKVTLHKLNHYRDFLNTKDVVSAIDLLRKKETKGVYNIGTGNQFNLKIIANLIAKKFNKKINFIDSKKTTYLISNNKKILKLNWKPKKFNMSLKYFY